MNTIYNTIVVISLVVLGFFLALLLGLGYFDQYLERIKPEPYFHLNDKVIVSKGFYKNSIGTLIDYELSNNKIRYTLNLEQRTGEDFKTKDRGIVSIIHVYENEIQPHQEQQTEVSIIQIDEHEIKVIQ
jgi:hypothetical protein